MIYYLAVFLLTSINFSFANELDIRLLSGDTIVRVKSHDISGKEFHIGTQNTFTISFLSDGTYRLNRNIHSQDQLGSWNITNEGEICMEDEKKFRPPVCYLFANNPNNKLYVYIKSRMRYLIVPQPPIVRRAQIKLVRSAR